MIWLRIHVVPPDCEDPDTLSLVRQSLTGRFNLPPSVDDRERRARSPAAMSRSASPARPICAGSIRMICREGTAVPGSVHYVSRLTADHQRHEVTVSIQPLLKLERVQ